MQQFQKIVIPIDAAAKQDPALERAADLGRQYGAMLKLVDVVDDAPRHVDVVDLQNVVHRDRKDNLERLAAPLRNDGLRVATEVLEGAPAYAITRDVIRSKHDLLMRTSRFEGIVQRILIGTLAMRLMRICPCPVWVVQPKHNRPFRRIAAAIDPFPDDIEKTHLNLKIVRLAHSLSHPVGCELHIVHAWQVYGEGVLERRGITFDVTDYLSRFNADAIEAVGSLVEQSGCPVSSDRIHLIKGPAGEVIPKFVEQMDVELLVMGTVARSGIPGFIIGNTAERILHQVGCSLLTIKPDGFISPVS